MGPIGHDLRVSRGQVSGALTVAQLSLVVSSLVWGLLLDRFGPRRMLLFGVLGLGISLACLSRATVPLWHLYLLFSLIALLGTGASPLGYNGVLVQRFQRRLGLALGLALMGVGFGAAIVPELSQHFIAAFGWRAAYLALATTAVVVGIPAALVATRHVSARTGHSSTTTAQSASSLMQTPTFLLICCIFFLLGTAGTGVITHLVPIMTDKGFSALAAAKLSGLIGISTLVSRGLVGWLLDRVHGSYLVAAVGVVCACLCSLLIVGGAPPVYAAVCILLGLIGGAEIDFISFLVRRYFGPAAFGRLYAVAFAAFMLGPGTVLAGYSFDRFHTYRPSLLLFVGISLLAALLAFALPPYETIEIVVSSSSSSRRERPGLRLPHWSAHSDNANFLEVDAIALRKIAGKANTPIFSRRSIS